jgi:hypothetical protein
MFCLPIFLSITEWMGKPYLKNCYWQESKPEAFVFNKHFQVLVLFRTYSLKDRWWQAQTGIWEEPPVFGILASWIHSSCEIIQSLAQLELKAVKDRWFKVINLNHLATHTPYKLCKIIHCQKALQYRKGRHTLLILYCPAYCLIIIIKWWYMQCIIYRKGSLLVIAKKMRM